MKGKVTIYEGLDGNLTPIFEESNMVVEGAKESIVDILTFTPPPSGVSSVELMAVSSFTVGALTLGSPSLNFQKHDSRYPLKLDHASGVNYLNVSGEILPLLKNIPNRLADEYGGVGKESTSQPRYNLIRNSIKGSDFNYVPCGNPSIEVSGDSIIVTSYRGQDFATLENVVNLIYGKNYTFHLTGSSDVEFKVAVTFSENAGGGKKYYNSETGKYQTSVYYTTGTFTEEGKFTYDLDLDYSEYERTGTHKFIILAPTDDLYTAGTFKLDYLTYLAKDSLILNNPDFSHVDNYLFNSDFGLYAYKNDIPSEVAKSQGIVQFEYWNIIDNYSLNTDTSSVGYVYRDDVLEGLTIQASSLDGSGSASVEQTFFNHKAVLFPDTGNDANIGFISMSFDMFSDTSGASGAIIELEDITTGDYYSFDSKEWSYNNPLVVGDTSIRQWKTTSLTINIDGREGHTFNIHIRGRGKTGGGMATYTFRNFKIGSLNGWDIGSSESIRLGDKEDGGGIYVSSNQTSVEGTYYSSVDFIGQRFTGIPPTKAMSLVIDVEPLESSSTIGVAITHRDFYNLSDYEPSDIAKTIGTLDLTKGHAVAKELRKGYAEYLNPYSSPSAVASPYVISTNSKDYTNSSVAVKFDASFQSNSVRLFAAVSPGTHTIRTSTTSVSQTEKYYTGLRVRHNDTSRIDYFYNFSLNKWIPLSSSDTPYLTNPDFRVDFENLDIDVFFTTIPSTYKTEDKYVLVFDFVSEVNSTYSLSFTDELYVHDISITGSHQNLNDSVWFNNSELPRTSYYLGGGSWSSVDDIPNPLLTSSTVPVGTVLKYDIQDGEQITIPIYGFTDVSATIKSTYDVHLFPLSGEGIFIKKAALCDYSLQGLETDEELSDINIRSSENSLTRIPVFKSGWHFHTSNTNSNDGSLPNIQFNSVSGTPVIEYVKETTNPQIGLICNSFKLSTLGLTSNKIKVSFDYFQDSLSNSIMKYAVLRDDFIWDWTDSTWKRYEDGILESTTLDGLTPITDFPYDATNTDIFNNVISTEIELPSNNLNDESYMTVVIYVDQAGTGSYAAITNLRCYSVVTPVEASSLFPEFPNPEDTTVQSPSQGPGRLGHFLNRMEFQGRGISDNLNYEEAVYDGCFAEGSGTTYLSSISYVSAYGGLNKFGVITPNGFILEQKINDRASQSISDSSAGMVVSAVSPVSSTRQISYALSLTKDEWEILNTYYGGVGAIGLWAYNFVETAKKFGSEEGLGGPPFITSGTPSNLSPAAGAGTPASRNDASANPQYLNGYVLKATSTTKSDLSLVHTGFDSPPGRVNQNGWCVSGDNYKLVLEYKCKGDNVKLKSDVFQPVSLTSDGLWHREVVTFTPTVNGHNKIGVALRDKRNAADTEFPEILIGSALLVNTTSSITVDSYDFSNPSDLDKFSIQWPRPNKTAPLEISWDGDFYTSSLYNSSVLVEKEPVYRLFSKKVFFPGGLQLNPSSTYLTIIWTIDF